MEVTAKELLILDTNTFVAEIGLTSRDGSALKHYLYRRRIQIVVPKVVAEECERNLTRRAIGKRNMIESNLQWLGRFCGRVSGWTAPNDEIIAERATALARADHLGAVVVPETHKVRRRAELRHQAERPPSHRKDELADCRIWEQCLDLLSKYHIVFVSADESFRGHREPDSLHPALQAEADKVAEDRSFSFHRTMECLLSQFKSEIRPIPNAVVFTFVYESIASVLEELKSNSGCEPKGVGEVKQTLLTTDQAEVIEVRLEIADTWEGTCKTMDFRLRGSCHYLLSEERLCDLAPSSVRLLAQQPDGTVRAMEGSYVGISAHFHAGAPPIHPEARRVSPHCSPSGSAGLILFPS